jgi:hypothetical protein
MDLFKIIGGRTDGKSIEWTDGEINRQKDRDNIDRISLFKEVKLRKTTDSDSYILWDWNC